MQPARWIIAQRRRLAIHRRAGQAVEDVIAIAVRPNARDVAAVVAIGDRRAVYVRDLVEIIVLIRVRLINRRPPQITPCPADILMLGDL